jgi:hypothetical protein
VSGENETESEAGQLLVLQPIRDRGEHFFCCLLVVLIGHEVRSDVVGELIGVDVNESTEQDAKLWRCEGGRGIVEDALEGIGAAFELTCAAGLFPFVLSLSRLCIGVDLNDTAWMVNGALGVGADSTCTSCAFAVDDDRGCGRLAGRHRFGVFVLILEAGNLGVLVARERTGPPLLRAAVRRLDLYQLRSRRYLPVDVLSELCVVAGCIETLIASYIRKERRVVSAATWAVGARACCRVESVVLAVEMCLIQREIDVVCNPCREVLGGEQMRFLVLPVLAPALREGFFLGVLREPCDEVGMAGCNALLLEGFSYLGDELEQSEAGIDEAIALSRFLSKGGDIIARQIEQPLKPLDYASYCTSLLVECTSVPVFLPLRYLRSE